MPKTRYWTCPRQAAGVKCGHRNPRRLMNCQRCGKRRPASIGRPPAHMKALDVPYEEYLALNDGVEACHICGATGKTRRLHRHHLHVGNGVPVGLLCWPCNAVLSGNRWTPEMHRNAADYLERAQQRAT